MHNDHLKKTLSGINPGNGVISSDDLSTEKIASFSLPDLEFSVKNSLEGIAMQYIRFNVYPKYFGNSVQIKLHLQP